jgi:hypothetical protein
MDLTNVSSDFGARYRCLFDLVFIMLKERHRLDMHSMAV